MKISTAFYMYKNKYNKYKNKYLKLKKLLENFEDKQCELIYDDDDMNFNKFYVIRNLIDSEKCDSIITEGNDYAKKYGWTLKRHVAYPTTDNSIKTDWDCYDFLEEKTKNNIFESFQNNFKIDKNKLEIEELFISKYDGNNKEKQNSLEFHIDGNEFSFVIALNDNYEGGGTHFKDLDKVVKINKGDCLIFCGQRYHGGSKVLNGVRYVIAGFINYNACKKIREEIENDD